jgi:hypothetical protein
MSNIFTAQELAELSAQVDEQLRELSQGYTVGSMRGDGKLPGKPSDKLPPQQCKAIEKYSKEDAETFLQKFAVKAKDTICEAESDLRKRYNIFGSLDTEETLQKFAGILAILGFTGIALKILTLAVTVYVISIGIKAFSQKYCVT